MENCIDAEKVTNTTEQRRTYAQQYRNFNTAERLIRKSTKLRGVWGLYRSSTSFPNVVLQHVHVILQRSPSRLYEARPEGLYFQPWDRACRSIGGLYV